MKLAKPERLDLTINKYNKAFLVFKNSVDTQKKRLKVVKITKYYNNIPLTLSYRIANQTRSYLEVYKYKLRLILATPYIVSTILLLISQKIERRIKV